VPGAGRELAALPPAVRRRAPRPGARPGDHPGWSITGCRRERGRRGARTPRPSSRSLSWRRPGSARRPSSGAPPPGSPASCSRSSSTTSNGSKTGSNPDNRRSPRCSALPTRQGPPPRARGRLGSDRGRRLDPGTTPRERRDDKGLGGSDTSAACAGSTHADGSPARIERLAHQPRSRHSDRCGRSAPSVVSLPCPG
jgi:hypothetical protein